MSNVLLLTRLAQSQSYTEQGYPSPVLSTGGGSFIKQPELLIT